MSSRKQNLMGGMPQIQPFTSTFRDSWEEQAFAEDSAGALGSYIWPPRSYTCSFCRREFRSAQALGGHMNVHRRDRARLKQLPTTTFSESTSHLHHHNNNNFHSYPSQSCSVMRNSNPNHGVVPQPRVSMVSNNQENCGEINPLVPLTPTAYISSSIIQESSKHLLWSSSSPSQSRTLSNTTLGLKIEGDSLKLKEMIGKRQRDSSKEEEEEMGRSKRQRIAYASINFLDLDPEEDHRCSEVIINRNRDPVEDIDLELRLGDSRN